ncbi:somatomedin-B and thrombospondin type-1 domain-containing protein [Erpetoichthys calabaricus]|uniref:somatomedin-B and thrombospondin type-1 domain-containing protein n=1 Tax=Erpetoichthys calabaricus TaxID=27687 RepID=UPI00223465F0|nr:somatomedin-B and thrombospondin type-1 domain-containing protein [Erpetoichthys calabaricus]
MASAKCACFTLMASLLSQLTPLDGGCTGKCCKGRDFTCTSTDWRMDRVYGICFCDETCRQTGDCCFDYPQTCPVLICTACRAHGFFCLFFRNRYCVQYKIETLSDHCTHESRPFARWMQYLREGFTVCVFCQPPALNMDYQACQGDGANFDGNETLQWQAVGNTKCRGTWRKVRRVEQCSCPVVHSFLFT